MPTTIPVIDDDLKFMIRTLDPDDQVLALTGPGGLILSEKPVTVAAALARGYVNHGRMPVAQALAMFGAGQPAVICFARDESNPHRFTCFVADTTDLDWEWNFCISQPTFLMIEDLGYSRTAVLKDVIASESMVYKEWLQDQIDALDPSVPTDPWWEWD